MILFLSVRRQQGLKKHKNPAEENFYFKCKGFFVCAEKPLFFYIQGCHINLKRGENMPNAKVLEQKKEIVTGLTDRMKNAASGIFVTYSGLSVAKDTELRSKLREAGVNYTVVKNTLARFAANELGYTEFDEILNGTTALATHESDVVAPAKILSDFISDNKEDAGIAIKAGFMEGKVVSLAEIDAIAKVPSKDTLYAMLAGALNSTIAGLARAVNAVKEQKEQAEQSA